MVDISRETIAETESRLLKVFRESKCVHIAGDWSFKEHPVSDFPACYDDRSIAISFDDSGCCSQLVPCNKTSDSFKVFSVHFPPDKDNSGFVGWLASIIKQRTGSGVFVICGSNSDRGGIYDYWGYPSCLEKEIHKVIEDLVSQ